jgi:hypothetical protein
MRVDQLDVKSALFEDFKQGNPVDPGRLHDHRLNLTLPWPLGQGVEVGGKGSKALHGLLIAITRPWHPMGIGPHINSGRVETQLF